MVKSLLGVVLEYGYVGKGIKEVKIKKYLSSSNTKIGNLFFLLKLRKTYFAAMWTLSSSKWTKFTAKKQKNNVEHQV